MKTFPVTINRIFRRVMVLFLIVPALLAAHCYFMPAGAEGPSQTRLIRSIKIKWTATDNDGIESRMYVRREYDAMNTFSLQYQIDIILTGQEAHEPGAVRVLIPKYIFHKRSGSEGGGVLEDGYGGVSFSVPEAPSPNANWHWVDLNNGQYAIVNDVTIDAAAQIMFQCSITNLLAPDLVDMLPSDPLKATVEVTDRAGGRDTMTSNELTAVIDTEAKLEKIENTSILGASLDGTVHTTPDSVPAAVKRRLPGGEETAGNYIFVCWKTQPYYRATQYFSLDVDLWAGEAEGNGASIPVILLGQTGSAGRIYTQDSGEQAGKHFSRNTAAYQFDDYGYRPGNRQESIWAAYPVAQMQKDKTYTIRSAVTWKMTEADPERDRDPQLVTQEGAEASVKYTHSGWEYPEGSFGVYKYTDSHPSHTHDTPARDVPDGSTNSYHKKNHTYDTGIGVLRNGQSVSLEYEVLTVGYGYAYTAGPTGEVRDLPEGWEQDPDHYLNWNYMMETTDDELRFQGISAGLQPGDYCFTEITVAAPEMFTYGPQSSTAYQLPGSGYGYRPDSSLAKPAVEVWIRRNNAWELWETLRLTGGKRRVAFPENVTGYRTRIMSNQAACKLAVWPKVTLFPTDHVKSAVEAVLENNTYAVLDNNVRLETLYYYSAERGDEVLPSQAAWLEAAAEENHMLKTSDSSSATLAVAGFKVSGTTYPVSGETVNDTANRRIKATIQAYVDEESNQTTEEKYNAAVAAGAIIPETSGTWFVLLPEKVTVNTSSVRLRGTGYDDHLTDVKVTENFRNTGRTMVEVHATMTPVPERYSGTTGYTDRLRLYMDVYLSWEDYSNMAASERNNLDYYVAFESGNPGRLGNLPDPDSSYQTVGYPDAWPSTGIHRIIDSALREALSGLDPAANHEERFVYARGYISPGNPNVSEQVEFRKDARYDGGGAWGKGVAGETQVTVPEGGEYTYRLTVSSKHDSRTAGIILYDAIEEHVPDDETGLDAKKNWSGYWNGKGQWQGKLISVDISELTAMQCAPKLYYSTVSGLTFGRNNSVDPDDKNVYETPFTNWDGDYKLSNTSIWTPVEEDSIHGGIWQAPDDKTVTAIAVDAQKGKQAATYFPLDAGKSFSVYLHMKAPDDRGNPDEWKAKGAYAHKKDNALTADDIDWARASDPANNMYAYNAATVVFVPFSVPSTGLPGGEAQARTFLNYRYDRVGIVPETISVRKIWKDSAYAGSAGTVDNYDGLRPASVTVRLNGVTDSGASPVISDTLVLSENSGWQGVFLNAPERDSDGNPYHYTVTEDPVEHYTTVIAKAGGTNGRAYEITNTHQKETVTITGRKLWLNPDGSSAEPDTDRVSLNLRRVNEEGVIEQVPYNTSQKITNPTKENGWTYTFSGFDRYAMGGYEYKYIIVENAPDGWFSQNDTPPAGVEVTAAFDPDDLTTFRNFRKPDTGYALLTKRIYAYSAPTDSSIALPEFSFTVELENSDSSVLDGEYGYIVYDKIPENQGGVTLPADAAQIGSGTVRDGGTIRLYPNQCALITNLPEGSICRAKEHPAPGWSSNKSNDTTYVTIQRRKTYAMDFRNTYKAEGTVTIAGTKRLEGREQQAKEFTFELIDNNRFNEYGYENENYGEVIATAKTGESRGTVTGADGKVTGMAMFTFDLEFDGGQTYRMYEYGGKKTLKYLIREKIPSGAQAQEDGSVTYRNVTYDRRTLDVTVTISDGRDGKLRTTVTTSDGSPLAFTNVYGFSKAVVLTARKEMAGRTLQAGEFSFEVRRSGAAADSQPLATGKNDADGNIVFSPDIILTEKDFPEATLVISEVKGTDPEVEYAEPVPVTVKLLQKKDTSIITMMHGQTLSYEQETCPACGGTGKQAGLSARYVDLFSNPYAYVGEPFTVPGALDAAYMDICPDCGGSGYDPARPGSACGTCSGYGVELKGDDPITLPDGTVLIPMDSHVPVSMLGQIGMDSSFIEGTSNWVEVAFLVPADQWTGRVETSTYSYAAFLYYTKGDGPCGTCGGSGSADGDPVVSGDPVPPVLTNRVKTGVTFSAEKTLDGKPASEPFTFVLLETDALRRTETEVSRKQNGTDGKVEFDPIYLSPTAGEEHYYVIREVPGEDGGIEYDDGEDLYRVTLVRDDDGKVTAEKTLLSGDGVFRNARVTGTGSLAIEVKTTGYDPRPVSWWAYEEPVFTVDVTLKDSEGKPLAGQALTTVTSQARNTAARRNAGPVTGTDGRVTVLVKAGETVEITGLPDGTAYEAEQPADSLPEGFSQSAAEGAKGTIRAGEQSRAVFENAYSKGEPTASPTGEPEPSATPSASPEPSETPTGEPGPSATPSASPEPSVTPTGEPDVTPTPTGTAEPTSTPAPSETPTASPEPTKTPKPYIVPKTGDSADLLLWSGMILLGTAAAAFLLVRKSRKGR